MQRIRQIGVFAVGTVGGVVAAAASAGDWPHWRGPNYDGISSERNVRVAWDDAGPRVLWEHEIGSAYSSVTCVGNRVYTCGTREGRQILFCLDAETGKELWSQPIEDEYRESHGDGTRATPTIDEGRIYIFGAHGRLVCYEATTGRQVWARKYDHPPEWGYSGSVLIQGDLAIVSPGRPDGALCALNKKTGEPVWKCGNDEAGYATPYPFTFEGTDYVCGFAANSAIVAELRTGKEVLNIPWKTDWKVNAATPIFHNGHLLLASGYSTGCGLFKLARTSDGLSAEEVWRSQVLLSKFQTPVLYEGELYTSDQSAFKCVDFMTGEQRWVKRGIKHGTVAVADGNIFLLTEAGVLSTGKASPEGFETVAKARILRGRCWTVPVLSGGRLFARNLEKVICVDLRQ